MSDALPKPETADEFIAWAMQQNKRYQMCNGEVIAMASERNRHNLTKQQTWLALREAVLAAGLSCTVLGDGATVKVNDQNVYEPDVTVDCSEALDLDSVLAETPVILVEVTSPSSGTLDSQQKLHDYFQVASVQHYLILEPGRKYAVHHARQSDGTILTRILHSGMIDLDPPGVSIDLSSLFPEE